MEHTPHHTDEGDDTTPTMAVLEEWWVCRAPLDIPQGLVIEVWYGCMESDGPVPEGW